MALVVKAHRPWRTRLLWGLAAAVLILGAWSIYEYGQFTAGYDSSDAMREIQRLKALEDEKDDEISALREQKAVLERAAQIERRAYDDLDATLKTLQAEILELKEELAFYRGIVSPRDASRGLRLQGFRVLPGTQRRSFRYKLVLTQVLENNRVAYGTVQLRFEGLQNGKPKSLALRDVTEKSVNEIKYRFKYFQNIEGDFTLPSNYEPLRVVAEILPRGRQKGKIVKAIAWPTEEKTDHVGKRQEKTETDSAD